MFFCACLGVVLASAASLSELAPDSEQAAMPAPDEDHEVHDTPVEKDAAGAPIVGAPDEDNDEAVVPDDVTPTASAALEAAPPSSPATSLAATMGLGMAVIAPIVTILPPVALLAVRAPVDVTFVIGLGLPLVSLVAIVPMAVGITMGRGWTKVGAAIWGPMGALVGGSIGALVVGGSLVAPEVALGLVGTQGFAYPVAWWGGATWGATLGAMLASDLVAPTTGDEAPGSPLVVGAGVAAATVSGAVVGAGATYALIVAALAGNQSFGLGYLGLGVLMGAPLATALPAAMVAAWALTPGPRTFVDVGIGALTGGFIGSAAGAIGGTLAGGRVQERRFYGGLLGATGGLVLGVGVGAAVGAALTRPASEADGASE